MPFDVPTKTGMFIRSGRLCCLCLKQCGINIEAAHIIDERDGGSNDFDNGIPVCFDCHAEIGSYNEKHPKGNKIRSEELKARRDRVYRLVESGVIYAQLVARRARSSVADASTVELDDTSTQPQASAEAIRFLKALLSSGSPLDAAARKLALLNPQDRAYVLDELLKAMVEDTRAISALARILNSPAFPQDEGRILVEQIVRGLTLYGSAEAKSEFLSAIVNRVLGGVYEGLRLAFFEDVIGIMERDQFDEVNKIVPALTEHAGAIPPLLYKDYVFALLRQARSSSWHGAPAARQALFNLPDAMAKTAMDAMDTEFLFWNSQYDPVRTFASRYKHLADGSRRDLFEDLANLSNRAFVEKHIRYEPS